MIKQDSKYCSKINTEKYLLNKMSSEEETIFQMHLEECIGCRTYLNLIRNLSCVIAEEELVYAKISGAKTKIKVKTVPLWSFFSIAASIIIIIGITFTIFNKRESQFGITTHDTYINTIYKADKSTTVEEMLFPDKEEITLNSSKPLEFRWKRETNYELKVFEGRKTVLDVTGFGDHFFPLIVEKDKSFMLDWLIKIDNDEFRGVIYINN